MRIVLEQLCVSVQKKTTSTFGAFLSLSSSEHDRRKKISISSVRYPTSPSLQQKTQRVHPTGARATSNHTKHNNESNKAHSQLAATETNTENKPLRTC